MASRYIYWNAAQLLTCHASGGCNRQPGVLSTGTISGPGCDAMGSRLELTGGGKDPVVLLSGETRRFLEDGDEILFTARCERDGFAAIGFGEYRARVQAASP